MQYFKVLVTVPTKRPNLKPLTCSVNTGRDIPTIRTDGLVWPARPAAGGRGGGGESQDYPKEPKDAGSHVTLQKLMVRRTTRVQQHPRPGSRAMRRTALVKDKTIQCKV